VPSLLRIHENAQARSAVALRPSRPSRPFIHRPVHVLFSFPFLRVPSKRIHSRAIWSVCFSSLHYDLPVPPLPPAASHQWPLVISLRNSDMIPILRKAQFKGMCGRLLLEQSQIVPIDSGESPPFSLTSPLNFMRQR